MILRAIVAGAVVFVLGALLFFIAIPGQSVLSDQGVASTVPATFYEPSYTPQPITFTVSWAEPIPAAVSVYSCGTDTSCSASSAYETPANLVAQGTATVGSLSFSGVAGNGYEVYANSSIAVNVVYSGPLLGGVVGILFLVIGAIALVAGAAVPASGLRAPTPVKDAVLRQPGEMLRWYWNGNWDGAPGGLLLSNQRLVLLDRRDIPGGSQFSTRESFGLRDLTAVEPASTSAGVGQLVLKTPTGAPRTFTLEGKFTPARAARAIQRASLMQVAGMKKGGVARAEFPSAVASAGVSASAPTVNGPASSPQVVYKEREVIREVVRIPCRFCGQLNDQLSMKCSGCGAAIGRT